MPLHGFSFNLAAITRSTCSAAHASSSPLVGNPGRATRLAGHSCLPPATPRSLSSTCHHPPLGPKHLLLPQAGPTRALCTSKPNCLLLLARNRSDSLGPTLGDVSKVGPGLVITTQLTRQLSGRSHRHVADGKLKSAPKARGGAAKSLYSTTACLCFPPYTAPLLPFWQNNSCYSIIIIKKHYKKVGYYEVMFSLCRKLDSMTLNLLIP